MPQTNEGIVLVVGAIFLLIGLLGGGIEIAAAKIPSIGRYPRVFSVGIGIILMGIALTRLVFPSLPLQPTVAPTIIETSTPLPTLVAVASTETPTNTPTPKPTNSTFTPTPVPTNTPVPPITTYLSDITPREISAAGDNYCIGYDPQPAGDTVSCGTVPIILQGQRYSKSLFAHANSTLVFDLNGKYDTFISSIFLFGSVCGDGATFRIELDGKEIYTSPVVKHGDLPHDIRLNVSGGYVLRLETFNGESGDWKCDGTVWGEPHLISK